MALFKFARAILADESIEVFNHGKHKRDFTYIDDIVEALLLVLDRPATSKLNWNGSLPDPACSLAPYRIYNVGNNQPTELMDYISALELALGKKAKKILLPIQAGDIPDTHADVTELTEQFHYTPRTDVVTGIVNFINWYRSYYGSLTHKT